MQVVTTVKCLEGAWKSNGLFPAARVIVNKGLQVIQIVDTNIYQDWPHEGSWTTWAEGALKITAKQVGRRLCFR